MQSCLESQQTQEQPAVRCPLNLASPKAGGQGELYQEDRDGAEVGGRVLARHLCSSEEGAAADAPRVALNRGEWGWLLGRNRVPGTSSGGLGFCLFF